MSTRTIIDHFLLDEEVDEYLQDHEVIPVLEKLIIEHIPKYNRLKRLKDKGKLKFGKKVNDLDQAKKMMASVKYEVDRFYKVRLDTIPEIDLIFSKKEGLKKSEEAYEDRMIKIVPDYEIIFETTLIHGYVHFIVEETYGFLGHEYSCMEEGLARVISEDMAQFLYKKTSNAAYIFDLMEDALADLWECYCWLSRVLKVRQNEKLLYELPFGITSDEKRGIKPDQYARGNSFFKIHQKLSPNFDLIRFCLHKK